MQQTAGGFTGQLAGVIGSGSEPSGVEVAAVVLTRELAHADHPTVDAAIAMRGEIDAFLRQPSRSTATSRRPTKA